MHKDHHYQQQSKNEELRDTQGFIDFYPISKNKKEQYQAKAKIKQPQHQATVHYKWEDGIIQGAKAATQCDHQLPERKSHSCDIGKYKEVKRDWCRKEIVIEGQQPMPEYIAYRQGIEFKIAFNQGIVFKQSYNNI